MKYFTAIITLIFLNFFTIIGVLYIGSNSSLIQQENEKLINNIMKEKEQLKINEVEYSYHNNFLYIKKLYNIYYDFDPNKIISNKRLTLNDFQNNKVKNVYQVISK